jgi:flagellar biosynthesis protein FliQ
VVIVAGPWMLNQITGYTEQLWAGIPAIVSQ